MREINNPMQMCSAQKLCFYEGREKGEKIIHVDNGCLSFDVLSDRCLDIFSLRHKGENISFISKNGLYGGNGNFNSRFPGGMLFTCGLDTVGGRKEPIHGKIHDIPADIKKVYADENCVEIIGEVRQSELFGENLLLKRKIYTEYGSGELLIDTVIENQGYKDAEYCLLFHMNIGYPMLDSGVKIKSPVTSTYPRTENAKRLLSKCFEITQPKDDAEEAVYFHTVEKGEIEVINEKLKKSVKFEYDEKMLPYFIEWRSLISGDYGLGIEPSTTTLDSDFKLKTLKAGEKHEYKIKIEINDL